ncbi:MAG: SDR family oxidoreductase [Pirellulales bacterium]|nr:SDR family oxidoreductase [Pirellulales bacterium]
MHLIVGCGYLGERVARLWLAREWPVAAVTRSRQRAEEFRRMGLYPIVADVTQPDTLACLRGIVGPTDHVLWSVGYDRHASPDQHTVYVEGLGNVLAALPEKFGKIISISSTGVYGQGAGELIDEDSPAEPTRTGGRACLAAEQLLLSHAHGQRAVILRLAGIYGPQRVPNRAAFTGGAVLDVNPDSYLNLIHVEDAVQAVELAWERAAPPRTYLIADGHPVSRAHYYAEVARLLNAPPPIFNAIDPPAVPSAGMTPRRGSGNKRIDNSRFVHELRPQFIFPDYRAGLAAILGGNE